MSSAAANGGRSPDRQPRVDVSKQAAHMLPFVGTRNSGKVPIFSGDRDLWSDWSFQFMAFFGSANPMATKALKWAAGADVP